MRQTTDVMNRAGNRRAGGRRLRRSAGALLSMAGLAGAVVMGGCQADSWFDPSVMGYWENTPTTMPILDRIAAIEDRTPELVETTPPAREDLIAEAQQYRLGPSDDVEIRIQDFEQIGFESVFPRQVDARGFVTLPRLGQVYVLGKTNVEAQDAIARAVEQAEILRNPTVSVVILAPRQQTFAIIGAARNPGVYLVGKPDYRLLDAVAAAGGIDESAEVLYVVRQIPLSDEAVGRTPPPPVTPDTQPRTAPPVNTDTLIDEIERLTQPPGEPGAPTDNPGGGLSVRSSGRGALDGERRASTYTGLQPDKPSQPIDIDAVDPAKAREAAPPPAPAPQPEAEPAPAPSRQTGPSRSKSRWVFLNGQWTRDVAAAAPATPTRAAPDPLAGRQAATDLLTQRVIEVPVKPLLAGQSDVNIVIRPGDVVRVPTQPTGVVYIAGQVARPGTFALPPTGKLTLLRAIDAAGGLSQLGIPERVDLTRMVGPNREATIRLNMRAIAEKTQPDVILKADDRVNVGTDFWAFPIAIIRNGFRMSYGFGFLLDRNFGNDVFGAPPESRSF